MDVNHVEMSLERARKLRHDLERDILKIETQIAQDERIVKQYKELLASTNSFIRSHADQSTPPAKVGEGSGN